MFLIIRLNIKEKDISVKASKFNLIGNGDVNNPYGFKDVDRFFRDVKIKEVKSYTEFSQNEFRHVSMKSCNNISFHNNSIDEFNLIKCSKLIFNDCKIKVLVLNDCYEINLNNCEIINLKLIFSYNNSFSFSSIDTAIGISSKYNSFPSTLIDQCRVINTKFSFWLILLPIIVIGAFLFRIPDLYLVPSLLLLGLFIFIFFYILVKDRKRANWIRNYEETIQKTE